MRTRTTWTLALLALGAAACSDDAAPPAPLVAAPEADGAAAVPQGDDARALAQFEKRCVEDPRDTISRGILAWLYIRRARLTGSADDLRRAEAVAREGLAKMPDHASTMGALGTALTGLHRFEDARRECKESLARKPGQVPVTEALFDACLASGRYDEAGAAADLLLSRSEGSGTLLRVARISLARGELDRAVEAAQRAATAAVKEGAHPSEVAEALVVLARAYFDAGRDGEAQQSAVRAVKAWERGADAHTLLSEVLWARGKAAQALTEAELAADQRPLTAEWAEVARLRALAADVDGTSEARLSAIATAEADLVRRGRDLAEMFAGAPVASPGDLERALSLLDEEMKRRPDSETRALRAWTLWRLGRPGDAAGDMTIALASGTRSSRILARGARVLWDGGMHDESRRVVKLITDTGDVHRTLEVRALEEEMHDETRRVR